MCCGFSRRSRQVGFKPRLQSSKSEDASVRSPRPNPFSASPPVPDQAEDRFHRFKLISWWDQKKLAAAKVLVVGAGMLWATRSSRIWLLLGVGNVLIADMDRIENSNLVAIRCSIAPADSGRSQGRGRRSGGM